MQRIESDVYKPNHFFNRYKRALKFIVPGLLLGLVLIHVLIKDAILLNTAISYYMIIAGAFVVLAFVSITFSEGRNFEGQYVEFDEENDRLTSKELYSEAVMFVKKEDLFAFCDIDLNEVDHIQRAEKKIDSNRVVGITLFMKEGYSNSVIHSKNNDVMRFAISVYGYDNDHFWEMANAIKARFEEINS